ncbi:hypothetical protein PT974_11341 [Cladobotryum mycophilum]|uniref:Major facilitator superfamily transporter n=1 Tax=Cladobotryum mycophilum TaxID=491253 RepID=A0ABR0S4Y3_9HYPO
MLHPQARRGVLARPRLRVVLLIALAVISTYYLLFSGPTPRFNIVPYLHDTPNSPTEIPGEDDHDHVAVKDEDDGSIQNGKPAAAETQPPPEEEHEEEVKHEEAPPQNQDTKPKQEKPLNMDVETYNKEVEMLESWDLNIEDLRKWRDPDDKEDPSDVAEGYETDGKQRDSGTISRLQHEKDMRKMWRYAYKATANLESSNQIYGKTLATLDYKDHRPEGLASKLRDDPRVTVDFSVDKPVRFNPYPDYNSDGWKQQRHAPYIPCKGPLGEFVEDLLVFKGRPHDFPEPKFGSYSLLNMDPNLCWERTTRLGSYGLKQQMKKVGGELQMLDWQNVNWGDLQKRCVDLNANRFDMNRTPKNEFIDVYPDLAKPTTAPQQGQGMPEAAPIEPLKAIEQPPAAEPPKPNEQPPAAEPPRVPRIKGRSPIEADKMVESSQFKKEKRTAILLRSYTGKTYTKNDKQTMRALISELTLKSGGEYEVFLLVHVKDQVLRPFDDPEVYQRVLKDFIPQEFHGITVLWNDRQVWDIYTKMTDENEKSVHTAQWLSVQKFSHDHPQFDHIWNWEMDFRFTGHHYDLLDNIQKFATKQPRKGLWERNERWYIPEHHGDYDTKFRKTVEESAGNQTIWGAPDLPFIKAVGPKAPVATAEEDDYKWGVGEEADYISVSPIFNPVNSNWIIRNHIWGYSDANHKSHDLPRRTTIVTQSRISKRLLDIMHIENQRGNHVASEMTPQTVALLHGFKAVYAPHPVFMDRDWNGKFLNEWFNPGPNGESGGYGSPMGWGRERRYQGNTWYYRAEPPNRLYNNWMGWVDTGVGGDDWEQRNGRPCLPSIMLHPVKDTKATKADHKTGFELAYG